MKILVRHLWIMEEAKFELYVWVDFAFLCRPQRLLRLIIYRILLLYCIVELRWALLSCRFVFTPIWLLLVFINLELICLKCFHHLIKRKKKKEKPLMIGVPFVTFDSLLCAFDSSLILYFHSLNWLKKCFYYIFFWNAFKFQVAHLQRHGETNP